MKKICLFMSAALIAMCVSTTSCKKDKTESPDDNVAILQDDALANDLLDEVDNEADDLTQDVKVTTKKSAYIDSTTYSGRDAVWTYNAANDSYEGTITFTNFQHPKAKNERIKNGIIHIIITGKRSENTYKRVVTFENFTINDNKIEGTKTIEKLEDYTYQITMKEGKITFVDGTFITCNGTRTRIMVKGMATPYYIWDDAYTFSGNANGVNRNGKEYVKTTTKPVKVYTAYRFPVEGTVTLSVGDKELTLDYGDGTLDSYATVTIDGVSKTISLKNKFRQ